MVTGDDVMPQLAARCGAPTRRWRAAKRPPLPRQVLTANAYLGALPVKAALDAGRAGRHHRRCVDLAVTLAC